MSLSLPDLDSHLFKCADIIRDAVDPTDYKEFILPLVYYKSISDEYEKQFNKNVEKFGDEDLARRPKLYDVPVVPDGYLWDDLRSVSDNVDQALNEAFDAVTDENPELQGVFRADYIDADALDDDRLGKLVEHLSTHDLDRDSIPPDMLGEAYMDLVRQFAEEEGKSGGQFFTPPHIVNLCVRLVDDFEDGQTLHDPTVGSGGMLIEAARYYREEQGGDPEKLRFSGQEINPDIAAIAKMNLSIHGLDGKIEREDSLSNPGFTDEENNELTRFDRVIANFPFSANWDKDGLQDDPYGRFDWHEKLPRADRGDYAFIMHMVKQLKRPKRDNTGGKAAIVIPHGVLFRKREGRYREEMINQGIVDAVIKLPDNLFQNNSIPSSILILNTNKKTDDILFIDASKSEFYRELSNQNELLKSGIDKINRIYHQRISDYGTSRAVELDEIKKNDYLLNTSLYVDPLNGTADRDTDKDIEKYISIRSNIEEYNKILDDHLQTLGYKGQQSLGLYSSEDIETDEELITGVSWTKIETLPREWSIQNLSDKVSIISGNNFPSEQFTQIEGIPLIRIRDLGTGETTVNYSGEYSDEYLISEYDLLIGMDGEFKPYLWSGQEALLNQRVCKIMSGDEYNDVYLRYALEDPLYFIQKSIAGTTVKHLSQSDIKSINLPTPPIQEQEKIAAVLWNIESLINEHKKMIGISDDPDNLDIASLRALRKSLIQDLLSGRVRTAKKDIHVPEEIQRDG